MSNKSLTLTIVIPVYNEESYLPFCLESIAKQTTKPDKVIIVDNNSTDKSVEIAKQYKFVKILSEKRQHQVYAQVTGFNYVKTDLIARIDADSILPTSWVKEVKSYLANHQETVAVTGSAYPYDFFLRRSGKFILDTYFNISAFFAGHRMLYGANFVMRTDAWKKVKDKITLKPDIWEDYDLSFCLARVGKIELLKGIEVETSFRAVHQSFFHQVRYQFRAVRTFAHYSSRLKTAIYFATWASLFIYYPFVLLDNYVLFPLFKGRKSTYPTGR